jgi:hypothetical protein
MGKEPLNAERAAELYPLVSDVREALGRLVEALEGESGFPRSCRPP